MKIAKLQNCSNPVKINVGKRSMSFKMNLQNYKQGVDENCVQYGAAKAAAKEFLKNENVLYGLYSGKTNVLFDNFLNDEEFLAELYSDPEFMKASSSALLKATDDKLKDETVSFEDKKDLVLVHNILTVQQELYNDPQNSFSNGLEGMKNNRVVAGKNGKYFISREAQPAFARSLIYMGFFDKPKTRREKAEAIVNRAAAAAAAESALLLTFTGPVAETAALTATTQKMCKSICEAYEMPGKTVTFILSQLSGAYAGKALANVAGKFFPGIGQAANATITYSLHQIQGRIIIDWCEKNYDNPNIAKADIAALGFSLLKNPMSSVLKNNPAPDCIEVLDRKEDFNEYISDVLG